MLILTKAFANNVFLIIFNITYLLLMIREIHFLYNLEALKGSCD